MTDVGNINAGDIFGGRSGGLDPSSITEIRPREAFVSN